MIMNFKAEVDHFFTESGLYSKKENAYTMPKKVVI